MSFRDFNECPECGAAIPFANAHQHVCDREQLVAQQLLRCRRGLERFERDLSEFLDTPHGRFEVWYAERTREQTACAHAAA